MAIATVITNHAATSVKELRKASANHWQRGRTARTELPPPRAGRPEARRPLRGRHPPRGTARALTSAPRRRPRAAAVTRRDDDPAPGAERPSGRGAAGAGVSGGGGGVGVRTRDGSPLLPDPRRGAAEGRGHPRAKWRPRGAARGSWRLVLASVGTPGGKRTAACSSERRSGRSSAPGPAAGRDAEDAGRRRVSVMYQQLEKSRAQAGASNITRRLWLLQNVTDIPLSGRPCVLCCSPCVGPGKEFWGAFATCSSNIRGSTSRAGPLSQGALGPSRQPGHPAPHPRGHRAALCTCASAAGMLAPARCHRRSKTKSSSKRKAASCHRSCSLLTTGQVIWLAHLPAPAGFAFHTKKASRNFFHRQHCHRGEGVWGAALHSQGGKGLW